MVEPWHTTQQSTGHVAQCTMQIAHQTILHSPLQLWIAGCSVYLIILLHCTQHSLLTGHIAQCIAQCILHLHICTVHLANLHTGSLTIAHIALCKLLTARYTFAQIEPCKFAHCKLHICTHWTLQICTLHVTHLHTLHLANLHAARYTFAHLANLHTARNTFAHIEPCKFAHCKLHFCAVRQRGTGRWSTITGAILGNWINCNIPCSAMMILILITYTQYTLQIYTLHITHLHIVVRLGGGQLQVPFLAIVSIARFPTLWWWWWYWLWWGWWWLWEWWW